MVRKVLAVLTVVVLAALGARQLIGGGGGRGDAPATLSGPVDDLTLPIDATTSVPSTTAPTETTGVGHIDSDLVAANCPNPVVVQTDWLPEVDYSDVYGLAAPGGDLDKARQRYTAALIDPRNGVATGVRIEIRSGGPAIGYQQVTSEMYRDPSILLGTVSTDEAVLNAKDMPTVAVVAPRERSSQMVMWDPATYPDVKAIADLKAPKVKIRFFGGTTYVDYLTSSAVALVDPAQVDATYDGTTTGFLADRGRSAQQGFSTTEPYFYEKLVDGWKKPVAYQLVADTGYDPYAGALAVRPKDIVDKADCLDHLVPMVQAAQVRMQRDPGPVEGLIHRIVAQTNSGWSYSAEQAAAATATSFSDRIISNGNDATLGNFDDDKIEAMIAILKPIAAAHGTTLKPGLTAPDLATNQFIDTSIGLAG